MKYSVSKSTEEFLNSLANRVEEDVVNYVSGRDELDSLILQEKVQISNLFIDQSLNLMLIVLSNSKVIKRKISDFDTLMKASSSQLMNFENDGMGLHWPDLDFDLSLKGFLQFELIHSDKLFPF